MPQQQTETDVPPEPQSPATPAIRVSVVMPVRNAMPFLDAAVASILAQTFRDFEFVIGDDGSDDGSSERLAHWCAEDPRIRLLRRDSPSGPAASSNWVAGAARGALVARMDADDIAHPERLARQVAILEADPGVVLTGSVWTGIDSTGRPVRPPDLASLLHPARFKTPFAHGSVMIRRSAFDRVGGYRLACDYWEDCDLFDRLARIGTIRVAAEPLYSYRFSARSNRLHAVPSRLERQLALQLACRAALTVMGDYEAVLAAPDAATQSPPLRVFQQRASLLVWAGNRSNLLFEWWRRRGGGTREPHFDWAAFAYLALAAISPRALRWFLARQVAAGNRRAAAALRGRATVDWAPGAQSGDGM